MAVVQGIKEKVHLPIYDSVRVEPEKQLRDAESSSTLKFFVNVQGKTKLETNLQSASLLPHYNTFEARAMRVVISDLPPEFPDEPKVSDEDIDVIGTRPANLTATPPTPETPDLPVTYDTAGTAPTNAPATWPFTFTSPNPTATPQTIFGVKAEYEISLQRAMELLREARENTDDRSTELDLDDEDVTIKAGAKEIKAEADLAKLSKIADPLLLSVKDLEGAIDDMQEEKKRPPKIQVRPNDGAGSLVSSVIYNTVTTLFVGEKEMIKMPTWFFPAGAGPYSEAGKFSTHGEPNPTATFRFAEPIFIDKQQNFRVEIEVPDSDTLKELQCIYGPLTIWVVLDGYMTRDVQ